MLMELLFCVLFFAMPVAGMFVTIALTGFGNLSKKRRMIQKRPILLAAHKGHIKLEKKRYSYSFKRHIVHLARSDWLLDTS